MDIVDTVDTADIGHTVDTLDIVESVNSVDNVSSVNRVHCPPSTGEKTKMQEGRSHTPMRKDFSKVRPALRKAGRSPFETLSSELPPNPLEWLRVVPNPFEEVPRPALREAGRSSSWIDPLGSATGRDWSYLSSLLL